CPGRRMSLRFQPRKGKMTTESALFNSLDAQRESAEAFIRSQTHEGWTCLPDRYDDGGFAGGNMERPALQRLLADIRAGKVAPLQTDARVLLEPRGKHHIFGIQPHRRHVAQTQTQVEYRRPHLELVPLRVVAKRVKDGERRDIEVVKDQDGYSLLGIRLGQFPRRRHGHWRAEYLRRL